jgi:hypothetical protein
MKAQKTAKSLNNAESLYVLHRLNRAKFLIPAKSGLKGAAPKQVLTGPLMLITFGGN